MNRAVLRQIARLGLAFAFAVFIAGCASGPYRPYVQLPESLPGCERIALPALAADATQSRVTPFVSEGPRYTLHFLEFDDQGWPYPDSNGAAHNGRQIDCALADLEHKALHGPVLTLVYVHGWNHSARDGDRDLDKFKEVLADQARLNGATRVVGFYVAWNGDSMTDTPVLNYLSFWSRKNAARHVAEGSVGEFFARLKTLRQRANQIDCAGEPGQPGTRACPVRTIMVGHSFGGAILYSSIAPYLLETVADPQQRREQGIADLVLLLNPAFEATRYEPLHRAAYRATARLEPEQRSAYQTPLLVSVTTDADRATKNAFPAVRWINTIFQAPSTQDQSLAMRRTHGHVDAYVTHRLDYDKQREDATMQREDCLNSPAQDLRSAFVLTALRHGRMEMKPGWERRFCGGMTLRHEMSSDLGPASPIWNIRTSQDVMDGHNEITGPELQNFVSQLYVDLSAIGGTVAAANAASSRALAEQARPEATPALESTDTAKTPPPRARKRSVRVAQRG
jgi:pimeloyl-ACP methyl ester carboxylesterase